MKKLSIRFLALFLAVLIVLSGCTAAPADGTTQPADATAEKEINQTEAIPEETTAPQDADNELWVVWGKDTRSGWPSIRELELMTEEFAVEHPNVSLRLETIPTDEEALQHLRVQIIAGDGPDVILMPRNAELISDPYQSMQNGLFTDISEYYDADTTFSKEDLNETIMEAGVINGKRYILPFYYDMPIAYIDVAQFEDQGGSMEWFDDGVMNLHSEKLDAGICLTNPSQNMHGFNFLPEIFDYENQEVLITQEDIAQFLRTIQEIRATELADPSELPYPTFLRIPTMDSIMSVRKTWRDYVSMYIGMMPESVTNAGFAKLSGIEIASIPVAAADGDLVADVSFYGAVLHGCDQLELAYELLRSVLLGDVMCSPLSFLSPGWSVYQAGSVDRLATGGNAIYTFNEIKRFYKSDALPEVTEADITFLNAKIDRVHFYTSLESDLSDIMAALNDPTTGAPTDVDIDAVAADFIEELEWHLYEG